MPQLSQTVAEELKKAYTAYYDISPVEDGSAWKALCAYHSRSSRYVLVKKAELWAAETHEYLYLWAFQRLEVSQVEEVFRRVLEDGEPRIKPHSEHMCTYLTAVLLYESAAPEALLRLKKLKKRRDYRLSLHGWMEFRIAAVGLPAAELTVNRAGRVLEKDLKRLVEGIISAKHLGEEKKE